jgi:hypothetical protein
MVASVWRDDYRFARFKEFLEVIKGDKYSILTFSDYDAGIINTEKVNVILRHDVDISLKRTIRMAEIQKELGVVATYFFRLHAEKYSFEDAIPVIKQLVESGFKIGLHYETLSQAQGNREQAIQMFKDDVQRLREFVSVSTVAAHGQKGYKNRDIWENIDQEAIQVRSAYDVKHDLYLSDAGGKRLSGYDDKYLFDRIYEAKPGQIVQVLIHPDWWI